jgi:hypothetical protein
MLDALNDLAARGYAESFWAAAGGVLRCGHCRTCTPAQTIGFDSLRRFEGDSDPDDMMAVVAVRCPACGVAGTAVLHYGPMASEEEADVLTALEDLRPADRPGVEPGP